MSYDVAIIGAGWAGFNAARACRDAGRSVALIEQGALGGTCLNRGCIPTKALLQSAKIFSTVKKAKTFGITTCDPVVSFAEVQARKEKIVAALTAGIEYGLKGVTMLRGQAKFISADTLQVAGEEVKAKAFIIATGSKPVEVPTLRFDGSKVISSDDVLGLSAVPQSLLIVGGGVIGCEFATLFAALGSKVTIVEKMPQLLPGVDKDIARKLDTSFKKKGIVVHLNADAGAFNSADFEKVLVCVGRQPMTVGLGLEGIGVTIERGRIVVDEYLRTSIPHIYAAGDCTAKIMLAHYAAYQGVVAAGNASGGELKRADNQVVPSCIFTDPEIATVGITEDQAQERGMHIEVKKFDLLGSGMARILDETEGFIKVMVEKGTAKVVGASLMGPRATELVSVLAVAITSGLTALQLKETIFAHPTLSESIGDLFRGHIT